MNWQEIFISDLSWSLFWEVVFRAFIMFVVILCVLRVSGKRGVRQLSIFEVAIIVALGSSAGDPMLYDDVAIVPAVVVCVVVILTYRLVTWLAAKFQAIECLIEGAATYIVEDGILVVKENSKSAFAQDEFFAELRLRNVEHLGQVRIAIMETTGAMSVFFFKDEEVRYGLPVLPKAYALKLSVIEEAAMYACSHCGQTELLIGGTSVCKRCGHSHWVKALNSLRIG